MSRKVLGFIVATALVLVALPVASAFAAPSATARLTDGINVFPGAGRSVGVEVANTGMNIPVVGGKNINLVLVTLPNSAGFKTSPQTVAPEGWTLRTTNNGTLQTYQFSGGSITPGQTVNFPLFADVAAPTADKPGTFRISVSDDNGSTASGATAPTTGTLVSTVKALSVEQPTAVAPALAADGSGTVGQTVTMATEVHNYATTALTVTPSLTSANSPADAITQADPVLVPAGGTVTFNPKVRLGDVASDRSVNYTAGAAAPGATAMSVPYGYGVQKAASITVDTATFAPKNVKPASTYPFSVNATKTGTPNISNLTGSVQFANTTATLTPTSLTNAAQLSYAPVAVSGADNGYAGVFTFSATDSNGFLYTPAVTLTSAANIVTIDSHAPVVTVTVALPSGQNAAKSGDTITVSGTVSEATAALNAVQLQASNGQVIPVTVTRANSGATFSGTVQPAFSASDATFTATARFTDLAGNVGDGGSVASKIDNIVPVFQSATTKELGKIVVHFSENFGRVAGGCSPSEWTLEGGLLVKEVQYTNDAKCDATTAPPNNDRVLILANPGTDKDYAPNVTYTPRAPVGDPAKDSAANAAVTRTVKAVIGIRPDAPVITDAFRNTAGAASTWEPAVLDTGKYYTRFSGTDFVVEYTGAAGGYTVQVLDSGKNAVTTQSVSTSPAQVRVPVPAGNGTSNWFLRLNNSAGLASITDTPFSIVVDTVKPAISTVALTNATTITMTPSEPIVAGTDNAVDWFGLQGAASNPDRINVASVAQNLTTGAITLTMQESMDSASFLGAQYYLQSPTGTRYQDRAGNTMNDGITYAS